MAQSLRILQGESEIVKLYMQIPFDSIILLLGTRLKAILKILKEKNDLDTELSTMTL